MPELVDVEGFRRVASHATGRRIDEVDVRDTGVLRGTTERALRDCLSKRRFGEPWRHGKYLGLPVKGTDAALLVHFGMTGSLHWNADGHRHDRVVLGLDGGELRYRDMRKLTGLRLARDGSEIDAVLDELGPDAMSVSREELAQRLGKRRRRLKGALMDQGIVAGLGNLMVDETLWRARLAPQRETTDLSRPDFSRLHGRMRTVLRHGTDAERVPDRPSWLTGRRDVPDGTCPRCGTRLEHGRVDGRSTVWCPHCQPS